MNCIKAAKKEMVCDRQYKSEENARVISEVASRINNVVTLYLCAIGDKLNLSLWSAYK